MENAINTLTTSVSADTLWGVFGSCIPYIAIVVVVSLRLLFCKAYDKGIKQGQSQSLIHLCWGRNAPNFYFKG